MHTVVTMPGTHRLTVRHPRVAFPDSKIDKLSRLYSPRLDKNYEKARALELNDDQDDRGREA